MAIDLETTGLDLRLDDIVSVGAVTIVDGAVDSTRNLYTLMRPVRRISAGSIKIHGLRTDDVFDALNPSEVAALVHDTCRESTVIAHAAWIENAMLNRLARGTRTPLVLPTVDTAAMARALGRATPSDREPSLEQLATDLQLPVYAPHHALGDALTTAVVFLCLATHLERTVFDGNMTVANLIELTARDVRSRAQW